MSRARVLQRRLRALGALEEAVAALRSLSAQHFRAARAPLAAVRAYREAMQGFLAVLGAREAARDAAPAGIVLVAADLGLVGDYTARLVREALALRSECGPGPLVCLGRRAVAPLEKAGALPDAVQPAPTRVAGLTGLLLPLVDTLLSLRREGRLGALWLVAARFEGAGSYTPMRVPVLPVAAAAGRPRLASSPYCDAEHLRAVVVREHLYASLYETLLEALASEHGKRLVTAESARSWLEERIGATRRLAAALRREASTQEVLEVVSAARAAQRASGALP
ncbi:MAG: F0F1 ATP synthase subunit gamma [Myxococcales bacterium]|nr:F0F1 ATP synthase subunit gamma [Myxococcales bacterium]MDH5306182.1 F0F1 ATP synthase subunit gamma [Myxococcales bacterium]MDH5566129.1 F0F1 ATP synthase subunit gamma [Myxococcales bacterium]